MAGRLFKSKTIEQQTSTLQSFMPGGRPFLACGIDQSNMRRMLTGLAVEMKRSEDLMNDITYEHQIDQTTLLIEEWEKALGLPDPCFPFGNSLAERRKACILKLGAYGTQTTKDFIDVGALFGLNITITVGGCYGILPFPCTLPGTLFLYPQDARHHWRIFMTGAVIPCRFPFVTLFPICFSDGRSDILECLFNILKPSTTILEFIYT